MKTRIMIAVNGGEYGVPLYIETSDPVGIKIISARKFVITSTPPVTIEIEDDIMEVKLLEVQGEPENNVLR